MMKSSLLMLTLSGSLCCLSARELATSSFTMQSVRLDPETVIEVMVDEVRAVDFARLMPGGSYPSTSSAAHSITLDEAIEYSHRLTELNRKLGVLKPNESLRLPTLAEWRGIATATASDRENVFNMDAGLREFTQDTKVDSFPSREESGGKVEHLYVAVIGAHDRLEIEAITDAMARPAWIRVETRSELVGFRLVLDLGQEATFENK
jgi:hypothetical protein